MDAKTVDPLKEAAIRAAGAWGLNAINVRSDLAISGSPQRSEFRCVAECADHQLVVLENIRRQDCRKKQAIIDRLDFLSRRGLSCINPYLETAEGSHIIQQEDRFWQASPYIQGVALDRPAYALEEWRGAAMADFLINLRKASMKLPESLSTSPFSILGYIDSLFSSMKLREPVLVARLEPVKIFLRNRLAPIHGHLNAAFCHGDYHPLNIIWSGTGMKCVIDWEFSGAKPDSYDAALLIGCLGMETPDALTGPLVMKFIHNLKAAHVLSGSSWRVLVEMIIAIRFGWLSEWLRNSDAEMIELETVYMNLLMDHADVLAAQWHC